MKIDLNEALDQLAKSFNVAVEELYPLLYKQAIIDGVFSAFWAVMCISIVICSIYSVKFIKNKQKESEEKYTRELEEYRQKRDNRGYKDYGFETATHPDRDFSWDWDETKAFIVLAMGAVLTLISLIIIPINLESAFTAFFNTDYHIIKNILENLKL